MNILKLLFTSPKTEVFNLFEKAIEDKNGVTLEKALNYMYKQRIDQDYVNYFLRLLPETWHDEHENIIFVISGTLISDSFSDIIYVIASQPEKYRKFDYDTESTLRKCIHLLKAINSEKSNSYIEKLKQTNNPNVLIALEDYK